MHVVRHIESKSVRAYFLSHWTFVLRIHAGFVLLLFGFVGKTWRSLAAEGEVDLDLTTFIAKSKDEHFAKEEVSC